MRASSLGSARSGPWEADPSAALAALDVPIADTALWRWPFASHIDYPACATSALVIDRGIADATGSGGSARAVRADPPL